MKHIKLRGSSYNTDNPRYLLSTPEYLDHEMSDYYFLSNDYIDNTRILKPITSASEKVIVGIGNIHFFHFIELVSRSASAIKRIIAIDNNPAQYLHFIRVKDMIVKSGSRKEFIENLFCVSVNDEEALNISFIDDAISNPVSKKSYELEKIFWKNAEYDETKFKKKNLIKNVKSTNKGLLINANTIGDINKYYATIFCVDKDSYELPVFSIGYGTGFLESEESFQHLKEILSSAETYAILDDIVSVYESIIYSNRYFPIEFWSSNIFDQYFINKHPALSNLLAISNKFNNSMTSGVTIYADQRIKKKSHIIDNTRIRKKNSDEVVHINTFRKIDELLMGTNNIELVNVKRWIKEDGGISKLPNTKYCHVDNIDALIDRQNKFDTVFAHILLGHGYLENSYVKLISKLKKISKRVIILEHNAMSKDFIDKKISTSVDKIRGLIGRELVIYKVRGKNDSHRNIIAIYGNDNGIAKKNILLISPEYITEKNWDGGLATYLSKITKAMISRHSNVHVVVMSDRDQILHHKGVVVFRIKTNKKMLKWLYSITLNMMDTTIYTLYIAIKSMMFVRMLNNQFNYEYIQAASYCMPSLLLPSSLEDTPIIVRISSIAFEYLQANGGKKTDIFLVRKLEKIMLDHSAMVYAPCRVTAKKVHQIFNIDCHVIETPYEAGYIYSDSSLLSKLKLNNKKYMLYFGTYSKLKGSDYIYKSIKHILDKFPDLHIVIIGKVSRKNQIKILRKKVGKYKERLIYHQAVKMSLLNPIIKKAKFVIVPSKVDNLPNTCIESMSMSKIVIATKESGCGQIIIDGKNGFLVEYGNVDSLINTINSILNASAKDSMKISKEARKTVETKLEVNKILSKLEGTIAGLANQ